MTLRVYNTLSKQKELFEPVHPGRVGMYLCGPTVYKPAHVGHLVGPVIFDAIKRYLTYKGFKVKWVVNITDVDDKLINSAQQEKTTVAALAEKYTQEYREVLALMGIDSIDEFPKASEHIEEIKTLCTKLIEKGFAYATGGNVWFDVSHDGDYGKLSHRKVEEQAGGNRDLEGEGKRNAADFALWKAAKPGEPSWDSPWGAGRPGWHVECSAMSMKYLGETLDIHGGGLDLMFPHHENELAQSESATGKPFSRLWVHNGLTTMKTKLASGEWQDEKMARSLGNVVSARELVATMGADVLRYLLLATHYRSPIAFSDDVKAAARKGFGSFSRLFERVERILGKALPDGDELGHATGLEDPEGAFIQEVLAFKMKFLEMMDDDFNTAGAIAVMHELASAINAFIEKNKVEQNRLAPSLAALTAAAQTVRNLGQILGLFRVRSALAQADDALTDGLVKLFIRLRQEARQSKNFALADSIRKGLAELGVTLEDRADGTGWRKD